MYKKCSIINVIARLCSKNDSEPSAGSVAFPLSVSECLSWFTMAIVGDLNPPQQIPPFQIFPFIAGIKKEKTHKDWGLLSYQFSVWPQEEGQSALSAWFKNTIFHGIQSFPIKNIQITFRELCQRGIAKNVYSVLLPAAHIYIEFSVNPVENTALHKNKVLFFPQGVLFLRQGWVPSDF